MIFTLNQVLFIAGFLILYAVLFLCLGFSMGRKTQIEAYERTLHGESRKRPKTNKHGMLRNPFRDYIRRPEKRPGRKPTIKGEQA